MSNIKKSWGFFTPSGNDSSGLLSWIKTLYGKIHLKLLMMANPNNQLLKKELEFKHAHAPVLDKMLNEFFENTKNKEPDAVYNAIEQYQKKWRQYAVMVNTINDEFKLMPNAFIEMLRERNAEAFDGYKSKNPLEIVEHKY